MPRIRKAFFLLNLLTFSVVVIMTITDIFSYLWYTSSNLRPGQLHEHNVYIDGRLASDNRQGVKYLSYQPPGGGWNNQRIVFENALVLAKLLNRTLIVHPLAPHGETLRNAVGDYQKYNLLSKEKLLPLSTVVDLKLLSKLVPIKEFTSSHVEFQSSHPHLRWARVCHNGLVGTWVDVKPNKTDKHKWRLLRRLNKKSLPAYKDIPFYRRICETEVKKFKTDGHRPVWGIMEEFPPINEEMLYFSEGCLRNQRLLFFDKKTVLDIHDWLMRFVRFTPDIQKRVRTVLDTIKQPFNAIHVRRTDHPFSVGVKQQYWLNKLKRLKALKLSKTLYIATDEGNKTWFKPFREAGYNVLFAEDFADQLQPKDINSIFIQDVSGICEQLICTHANKFVGSPYSSFTMYIGKMRKQFTWKKGMLLRKRYSTFRWIS